MASYINGITTYIQQIQPSDVNLQIESQYANMRQSKHDAARQQISNLYGSLLNSPLSREDNNIARDNFFKTIEGDIKRISGMDLSLQQNVTQAQSVFNQLLDDKYILKDMAWTKNFQNQVQISDYLKNVCTDSSECDGMWWDGGDRLLQYQMEDFQNATADDSLRMGDAHYIAKQDVTRMALDFAKEYGVDMKAEQSNGMYIFTQKNGELALPMYSAMFNGMIAQNPKVMEYYNAKARVERLDYMHQHAEEFGSMEAAEQDYINKIMYEISTIKDDDGKPIANISQEQIVKRDAENAKDEAEYNKKISDGLRVVASKQQDANTANRLNQDADELAQHAMFYEREYDRNNNIVKRINSDTNNQILSGEQIDMYLGNIYLKTDVFNAATLAAFKDSEVTIREDKYGLEQYKRALQAQAEQKKYDESGDYSSLYDNSYVDTQLGTTVTEEGADVFEAQMNQVATDYAALKSDAKKAVVENEKLFRQIQQTDAYKNLSDEERGAFKSAISRLGSIYSDETDLSKDILQPLKSKATEAGFKHIESMQETINKLASGNDDMKDALSDFNKSIDNVKTKYKGMLEYRKLATLQAEELAGYAKALYAENGNDGARGYLGTASYLKALADGKFEPTNDIQGMKYLGAGEMAKYLSDDDNDLLQMFMNEQDLNLLSSLGGEKTEKIKTNGLQLVGLISTCDDSQGIWDKDEDSFMHDCSKALEKNYGVETKNGFWRSTFAEVLNTMDDFGLDRAYQAGDKVVNTIAGWFGADEPVIDTYNKFHEGKKKFLETNATAFTINGKSIWKQKNGKDELDENGERILTDEAYQKLKDKKDVDMRIGPRGDYIRHRKAVLNGSDEWDDQYVDWFTKIFNPLPAAQLPLAIPGYSGEVSSWGKEDTNIKFQGIANEAAKRFNFLSFYGNDVMGFDGAGNLATKAHVINATNNEDSATTQLFISTFDHWARENQTANIKFTTAATNNISDAESMDEDFREVLKSHGLTEQQLMNEISMALQSKAKRVAEKKDGTKRFFDEDDVTSFVYAPIALGSASYSVLRIDQGIINSILKKYDIKSEEIPSIYIYNKHSNNPTSGSDYNGYSPLDNKFKHSVTANIVDYMGKKNQWYDGLYYPQVENIQVLRDGNMYRFVSTVPKIVNGKIEKETIMSDGLPYSYDDGFDLAWEDWQRILDDYVYRYNLQYYSMLRR